MGALLHGTAIDHWVAASGTGPETIAQGGDIGDWGQLIVIALVVVASGLNGLIQAAKKKREARQRERPMPPPKPTSPASREGPAPARPQSTRRPAGSPRRPVPLRPKPQAPRPAPVSTAPPPRNIPPVFDSLADAIRKAGQKQPQPPLPAKRTRPHRPARKPPPPTHQAIADRHVFEERERRRDKVRDDRFGYVAEGAVSPLTSAEGEKARRRPVALLGGMNLRQAIVAKEIFSPPVALRYSDDYFSP